MSLLFRGAARPVAGEVEPRAIDSGLFTQMMASRGGGSDRALRLSAVYSAVALLSDAAAMLPLHAYRKRADRREPVEHRLVDEPSAVVSRFGWVHQAMTSLLLRGNAYGLILKRDHVGVPTHVEWLPPQDVTVEEASLVRWVYRWDGDRLPAEDLVHVSAFPQAGQGASLSPIGTFAVTFDGGLEAVQSMKDWYSGGTIPSLHLKNTQQQLSKDQADKIKERYLASINTGDPVVTGNDWDFTTVGVSAQDAAYLDAIKATASMVAAIYRVPPEMVGGETNSSLTYATTEQHALEFQVRSLLPWLVRLESALDPLLPRGQFVKFNLTAGVRADAKTQAEITQTQLESGTLTQDEARLLADRDPLTAEQKAEWLDSYARWRRASRKDSTDEQ